MVIGAGSAGLVSAYIAAAVRAKVTLIEKHRMGGDCLNTGCVPSKALIKIGARAVADQERRRSSASSSASAEFDFADVMERVQRVIAADRAARLGRALHARSASSASRARRRSPRRGRWRSTARPLTTRAIVIAAGARPFVPPIPGHRGDRGTSPPTHVWDLRELPRRLLVLGGGPIGCELAQAFARFGSQVTQVEMLPRILAREDPEVSEMVRGALRAEGIDVLARPQGDADLSRTAEDRWSASTQGKEVRIEFDALLCAVGRVAEHRGLRPGGARHPAHARRAPSRPTSTCRPLYPNIYACGDVAGPYQFTHTAAHQAWYASVNALFGRFRKFRADYSVIPWATFTDPEVARVGLNETEAKEHGIAYEVTRYGIDDLDRAIADEAAHGFVKVLTVPGKDRILGATIVGEHAGDLIVEFVAAMKHGIGLNKILGTIHIYPTLRRGEQVRRRGVEEGARAAGPAAQGGAIPRLDARLSIVVPALNEAPRHPRRARGARAAARARPRGDRGRRRQQRRHAGPRRRLCATACSVAPRGRALQMNAGARAATGDVLLFLHADTRLPAGRCRRRSCNRCRPRVGTDSTSRSKGGTRCSRWSPGR